MKVIIGEFDGNMPEEELEEIWLLHDMLVTMILRDQEDEDTLNDFTM